jgi:hypothetical protein
LILSRNYSLGYNSMDILRRLNLGCSFKAREMVELAKFKKVFMMLQSNKYVLRLRMTTANVPSSSGPKCPELEN